MAIKGYLIISLIFFFINTMIATNCFSSLPYRQLRKLAHSACAPTSSSLPYRQLRKLVMTYWSRFCCSLPYRQLRK
ncbi:hypothetical protein HMPREF3207_01511 [Citrobacter koseri]|nr:hypothetical protein HMPREF3207_01511 [Citrobacter koseri]